MGRMHAVELVFAIGWAAFWIYWLVAAFSMKRGHVLWSRELRIRAVVVVGAFLLIRVGAFREGDLNTNPWRVGIGLLLFVSGWGSRSGPEERSGATGAHRCHGRTNRSW